MLDLYLKYWRNYAVFSGRACRKEVCAALLGNICMSLALLSLFFVGMIFAVKSDSESLYTQVCHLCNVIENVFYLAMILPWLGVCIRRLHDTDHSGWWWLTFCVPIVNLYLIYLLYFAKGTDGDNRYGADPLANVNTSANKNASAPVDVNADGD